MRHGLWLVILGLLLTGCGNVIKPEKEPGSLPSYDYAPTQEPNTGPDMGSTMIRPLT